MHKSLKDYFDKAILIEFDCFLFTSVFFNDIQL